MIPPGTDPEVAKRIILSISYQSLRNRVASCSRCALCQVSRPVPSDGASSPTLAVILPPPSPMAAQQGLPLVGRERDYLEESLAERAGVPWSQVRLIPSLGCRPDSRLVPTQLAELACHSNLADQLAHGGAESVLILGETALRAIRPQIKFGEACSKGWLSPVPGFGLDGRANYVSNFVTIEPRQALDNKRLRPLWESDLDFLGRIAKWKWAEMTAEFFSDNRSAWPDIIGEKLSELNPYRQEKALREFGALVEEISGKKKRK